MRTHIQFRSSEFPAYPYEMEGCEPGRWGKRLAEYMRVKLDGKGFKTKDICPEDWGWLVPISHDDFPLWVGCKHSDDNEDSYLVFIEPSKPVVRKGWFEDIDTTVDVARVADALEAILKSDPKIRDVRWLAENER